MSAWSERYSRIYVPRELCIEMENERIAGDSEIKVIHGIAYHRCYLLWLNSDTSSDKLDVEAKESVACVSYP